MRILLQFPEGLKKHALEHARRLESEGHEVLLSASPTYGACDLALDEASALGADKIIHFGHAKFPLPHPPKIPIEYVEWKVDVDEGKLADAIPQLKKYKKLALVTTVQHAHDLEKMKKFLSSHGVSALTKKGILAAHEGQILGCDGGAAEIPEAEAVLYVGDGVFHPLAIASQKPVYTFNPYTGQLRHINVDLERLAKRRKGAIAAALSAKTFGILLSTKPGQSKPEVAKWARRRLEELGIEAHIIVAGEFNPYSLANFASFDAYVNTACPRMADDTELFGRPILNPDMLEEMAMLLRRARKQDL